MYYITFFVFVNILFAKILAILIFARIMRVEPIAVYLATLLVLANTIFCKLYVFLFYTLGREYGYILTEIHKPGEE